MSLQVLMKYYNETDKAQVPRSAMMSLQDS